MTPLGSDEKRRFWPPGKRRKTKAIETQEEKPKPKPKPRPYGGDLPDDIMLEILHRLPLKSLSSFRKVARSWNDAIYHPSFAKMHYSRTSSPSVLLNTGRVSSPDDFYLVDHQVFDNYQESSTAYTVRFDELNKMYPIKCYTILEAVNGLFCLLPHQRAGNYKPYCIWNPIIQEHVILPQSPLAKTLAFSGFGYDSINDKYKFIRIIQRSDSSDDLKSCEVGAEIYTLGSRRWRGIQHVPSGAKQLIGDAVLLEGSLHWLTLSSIVVFNLTTEQFHGFQLPATIDLRRIGFQKQLKVFEKCLCIWMWSEHELEIWSMKDYNKPECWTKDYMFVCKHPWTAGPVLRLRNRDLLFFSTESKLSYTEPQPNIFRQIKFQNPRGMPEYLWVVHFVGGLLSPKHIENSTITS